MLHWCSIYYLVFLMFIFYVSLYCFIFTFNKFSFALYNPIFNPIMYFLISDSIFSSESWSCVFFITSISVLFMLMLSSVVISIGGWAVLHMLILCTYLLILSSVILGSIFIDGILLSFWVILSSWVTFDWFPDTMNFIFCATISPQILTILASEPWILSPKLGETTGLCLWFFSLCCSVETSRSKLVLS